MSNSRATWATLSVCAPTRSISTRSPSRHAPRKWKTIAKVSRRRHVVRRTVLPREPQALLRCTLSVFQAARLPQPRGLRVGETGPLRGILHRDRGAGRPIQVRPGPMRIQFDEAGVGGLAVQPRQHRPRPASPRHLRGTLLIGGDGTDRVHTHRPQVPDLLAHIAGQLGVDRPPGLDLLVQPLARDIGFGGQPCAQRRAEQLVLAESLGPANR
jgi:hypothetical protein